MKRVAGLQRPPRRTSEQRAGLATVRAFLAQSLPRAWAALGAGVHRSTAQRWLRRSREGQALAQRRGPHVAPLSAAVREASATVVRDLHGLIGADALRHTVPGLTRRAAAQIKSMACRELERERRESTQRVVVAAPGVVRGFDAMELCAPGLPRRHALIAADGCVPYRTSWTISERYDGCAVAALLDHDFSTNGAPLVLRMDRAASHTVPAVHRILCEHGVLPLQGPPYYARYYGQLERQNREHRDWLSGRTTGPADFDAMMAALNDQWRRATLGWCTAGELWRRRPPLHVDRKQLSRDVHQRSRHLARKLDGMPRGHDLAWRLAVRQTLVERGLMRIENGGWC